MTYYPAAIPLLAIQQLHCPKCRTRMRLARISPGPTGFELRTFECCKCDSLEQIAIASDPMKSGAVGWFTGELRPPKQTAWTGAEQFRPLRHLARDESGPSQPTPHRGSQPLWSLGPLLS